MARGVKATGKANLVTKNDTQERWRKALKLFLAILCGLLHRQHVSVLWENDRHFSHLSSLEREMGFRTEMGLYYSYYKTVVESVSFTQGIQALYRNNLTEYPDTINVLKRFNLYPEVVLGGLFRIYNNLAEWRDWRTKTCWKINRGEDVNPVWSCEGLGDMAYFYLEGVWWCAALTGFMLFLLGTQISNDSLLGGLVTVTCFMYNHSEATRVQWTPPLRESFAFPVSLLQMYFVCGVLISFKKVKWPNEILAVSLSTLCYILLWQFAQFALLTQVLAVYVLYSMRIVNVRQIVTILYGVLLGLFLAVILMFGNEMLVTSWLFACCLSTLFIIKFIQPRMEPKLSRQLIILWPLLLVGMLTWKGTMSYLLAVKDDFHVINLLRSKFTSYRDFHTKLYTCAREFDFLDREMPIKITFTLLLPSALIVMLLVGLKTLTWLQTRGWISLTQDGNSYHLSRPNNGDQVLPSAVTFYHLIQMLAFTVMAAIIMRLKLFLTPQVCIFVAILTDARMVPLVRSRRTLHLSLIAVVLAGMSVQGVSNLRAQHQIVGEYSNPELEDLIEWINRTVPLDKSFAGPMPLMANLLLSTRRPIINHPHYEDEGMRERTKKVYQMYSRRTAVQLHQTLTQLQTHYLVLAFNYCHYPSSSDGCGMTDLWDLEEPVSSNPPLCPVLWHHDATPFKRVFKNQDYVVLEV